MNNKEKIKNVYDDIRASDALFRKVMSMNKKESKTRNIMKFAATAVAGLALMFVASNGICYAATGETLTSKVRVFINGEEKEAELTWTEDENGVYGEYQIEVDEGEEVLIEMVDESGEYPDEVVFDIPEENADANAFELDGMPEDITVVGTEDGKIYLRKEGVKVDITEDFADGTATGSIECPSGTYNYTITGTIDEYELRFSN